MEWTEWDAAIEKNREALKRVLVTLAGMAGPKPGRRFFLFRRNGGGNSELAQAEKDKLFPALAFPRHLHRAMLMLLRPAEAAARRLVIAAARGLVEALPPPREPKPISTHPLSRSLDIAVTTPPAPRPRKISLPLLDPLRNPFDVHRHSVPAHAAPRIMPTCDGWPCRLLPPPLSRDDPIDAARLGQRLAALAAALDDLPAQARRFARWKARNDAAIAQQKQAGGPAAQDTPRDTAGPQGKQACRAVRFRRTRPLKPGRPQAWQRKLTHQVREDLNVVHGLACRAPKAPDTS